MGYPAEFYYRQTKSAAHYWDIPVGTPDFNRLIQGKSSYWRNPSARRDKKQKKLVLADWTAYNWSLDKIDAVKTAIAHMIDEGFTFYIWQNGQLQLLEKDTLDQLEHSDVRQAMAPAYNQEIIDAAISQHHIASSEIHVLDDYWLQHILEKDDQPPLLRHLNLDDITYLLINGWDKLLFKILDIGLHSRPPLDLYISDQSGFGSGRIELKLLDILPNIRVEHRIKKLIIRDKFFIDQVLSPDVGHALNSSGYDDRDNNEFEFEQLDSVEDIHFYNIDLTRAEKLIQQTPSIVSLLFQDIKNDDERLNFGINNLRNLSTLSLHCNNEWKGDICTTLLSNMPNLLSLSITQPISNLILPPNSLMRLTELKIGYRTNSQSIYAIFAAAPNLKRLQILNFDFHSNFDLGDIDNIEEIESLFSGSYHMVSLKKLGALFSIAKNLKKLKLQGCYFPEADDHDLAPGEADDLDLAPGRFKYLEEIDLSGSIISVEFLLKLIKSSQSLKKINLSGAQINCEKTKFFLDEGSLRLLKEINFVDCKPSRGKDLMIQVLKAAAPNLTKFELYEKQVAHYFSPSTKEMLERYKNDQSNVDVRASATGASANTQRGINVGELQRPNRDKVDKSSTSSSSRHPETTPNIVAKVDADTSNTPDKEFNLTRIFYSTGHDPHPLVSHYRLSIFDEIQVNPDICRESDAFSLLPRRNSKLVTCNPIKSDTDVYQRGQNMDRIPKHQSVYGKQVLSLTRNWQAIASLSAGEAMTHFHSDPPHAAIEIQRSEHDNRYYIRSLTGNQTIDLDFILSIPDKKIPLPAEIQALINKFNRFGEGKLDIDSSHATGHDYLNAMINQEKGACRHRAVAFKAEMQRLFPDVPTRIITNNCHAFAEVQMNDQWVACQLGGYEAKLTIHETNNPEKEIGDTPRVTQVTLPSNGEAVEIGSTKYYENQLETWESTTRLTDTYKEYCQQCLLPGKVKKRLIKLDSSSNVDAMRFALQDYCLNESKRPFFYVNSPDDFVCSAPYVTRHEDNTGELKKGPGGPLHDFLVATRESDTPPILLINYDNFEAEDIVRINSLLDKERRADHTPLPENALVIGLINVNKPDCYQGSDFYSRFDEKETCVLSDEELAKAVPFLPIAPQSVPTINTPFINLYHALDWKERLLGRWGIDKGNLRFEKGALVTALEQQVTTIEIKNGLMDDPDFQRFWRDARLCGYVESAGQRIPIPDGFQFIPSEGYDWSTLKQNIVSIDWRLSSDGVALNPTRLGTFFNRYDCNNETRSLLTLDGVIPSFANQTLEINVTRTLNDDEWAMILDASQSPHHDHVKLHIHCAPGVKLPEAFMAQVEPPLAPASPWDKTTTQPTQIIVSTDSDTTLATLTQVASPNDIIIDVSECGPSDLLTRINGKLNDADPPRLAFKKTIGIVKRTLTPNEEPAKRIILKGRFSPELADELSHYLFEREQTASKPGQLIIISEQEGQFAGHPMSTHTVTIEDKRALLGPHKLPDKIIEKESLNQLKARCHYININPGHSSDDAWIGMRHLSPQMQETGAFDAVNSAVKSELFTQVRLDAVKKALGLAPFEQESKQSPFVFMTGLSGVGKSTFVKKELIKHVAALHLGENKIAAWASDSTPGTKILFIDEANLSQNEWSQFEGLFHTPPGIYVREDDDDHYYPLSPDHKVIFAGNPCSYGAERQLAPFFERYGKSALFTPLPPESIYELTLKPILEETGLSQQTYEAISHHLLDVYRFLCAESERDVLITPRELQMMALLVSQHHHRFSHAPNYNVMDVTKKIAWDLAKHLVPIEHRTQFDQSFRPIISLDTHPAPILNASSSDFKITESRQPIALQLDDLLALRLWRQKPGNNDVQKFGGLGGIVLEGEPGVGKSELIIDRLIANGVHEMHDFRAPPISEHVFYRMPVSMPVAEKEALLLKAFYEGSVVVIDEINCSPMMERFLNDLLMGEIPVSRTSNESDNQITAIPIDKSQIKPGFMIMGTQNPITMAGRRATSTALQRRLLTQEVPIYPRHEMVDILLAKGLSGDKVDTLIRAYEKSLAQAQAKNLSPAPNFRDIIRLADDIITGHKRLVSNVSTSESNNNANSVINPTIQSQVLNGINNFNNYVTSTYQNKHSILQQNIVFCTNARNACKNIQDDNPTYTQAAFNEHACKAIINLANQTFKHRDFYKRLLADFIFIPLGVATVGILFAAKYALTGSPTFFTHKTNRQQKVDELIVNEIVVDKRSK